MPTEILIGDEPATDIERALIEAAALGEVKYSDDQPRDESGRWTDGSGGSESAEREPIESLPGQQNFQDDEGHDWNERTAQQKLVQKAKAAIKRADEVLQAGIEAGDTVQSGPASWDEVPESEQEIARNSWEEEHIGEFQENYIHEWHRELETDKANEVKDDEGWQGEWFAKWAEDAGFTRESAEAAFSGTYNGGPDVDASQLRLSGDDDGTDDERAERAEAEFNKLESDRDSQYESDRDTEIEARIESAKEDGPPDSITDAAFEDVSNAWHDLSDDDKFEYAGIDAGKVAVEEPETYEVLEHDETGYKETRGIVRYLQQKLTAEVLEERGIEGFDKVDAEDVATTIWSDWKGSSTSEHGLLLQYATALELGGDHRLSADQVKQAMIAAGKLSKNNGGGGIGPQGAERVQWHADRGLEIAKAHVYATWAASQHALEKAGIESLPTYRGVMWNGDELASEPIEKVANGVNDPYQRLTDLKVLRNGAASFTTDKSVANSWNGVGEKPPNPKRVVLRVSAPREAVLSLPVFGQNVHAEQEVVLAGTKWHSWDAWLDRAPDASVHAIKRAKRPLN